jgi:hypothetical protein
MADPVWLQKEPESVGRDHLGVQAASQTIYARLLPGIRNLTKRARYFSFYPWVIDTYARRVGVKDAQRFNRYLRRAEYILTLATALQGEDEDTTGAIGIRFVNRLLDDLVGPRDTKQIDIEKGANDCEDNYFRASRGGYGIYYVASLAELGIIEIRSGEPVELLRPVGQQLAASFAQTSGAAALEKAFDARRLSVKELRALGTSISLSRLTEHPAENDLLRDVLFNTAGDPSEENTTRRQSFCLVLTAAKLLRDGVRVDEFRHGVYYEQDFGGGTIPWPESLQPIVNAWRVYQQHEYFNQPLHYLFHQLLDALPALEVQNANTWADYAARIRAALRQRPKWVRDSVPNVTADTRWTEFLQTLETALGEDVELPNRNRPVSEQFFSEVLQRPTQGKPPGGSTVWAALGMLGSLAVRARVHGRPYADAVAPQVSQRFGLGLDHLLRDFSTLGGLALADAAVWLVEHYVVRRHLHVALRKLSFQRQGENTFKFFVENGRLRFRKSFSFGDTTPRVASAILMLVDLGMLQKADDGRHRLTVTGQKLLQQSLAGVTI